MNRLPIAMLALLMFAPLARGDDEPPSPRQSPAEETVSEVITIDMNAMPLVTALQTIARMGSLNVVIDAALVDDKSIRDVDITGRYENESARDLFKVLALSNGLRIDEQENGVILIRPGLKRTTGAVEQVVEIHMIADLAKDEAAARELAADARSIAAGALVKLQGQGALVVKATPADQQTINNMLTHARLLAQKRENSRAKNEAHARFRLRFFDVRDLIRKYHKLQARMRRLFPELKSVEQRGGTLIVRATAPELDAIGKDLDGLRRTLRTDPRNGPPLLDGVPLIGRTPAGKRPPPPPPSGAPVLQPEVGADASKLPAPPSPSALKKEQEQYRREVEAYRNQIKDLQRVKDLRKVEADRAAWQKEYDEKRARFIRKREEAMRAEARFFREREEAKRAEEEAQRSLRAPTEEEWERAAHDGPLTLEQRIESLRGEVRALRGEVRQLRALLEQKK